MPVEETFTTLVLLQNVMGDTPLHLAAHHGHLEVARLLLSAGADISLRNNDGAKPEDIASNSALRNVIQMSGKKDSDSKNHKYNDDDYDDESD